MRAHNRRLIGEEARKLHALGFALHLVKPRSKKPVENAWTTGPRKTFDELQSNYARGMNLGVRLGEPSKVSGGFLAVLDCDLKSADPRHQVEAEKRLGEIFGKAAPTVLSGRGNGSKHVYVLTRAPVAPKRLAQSSEKVRVHMPSAEKWSKYEEANLSAEELAAGIRIRAAWEISLMSTGQQVVLPGSVHPDTGREYAWGKSIDEAGGIPFADFQAETKREDFQAQVFDFEAVPVDLVGSRLASSVVDAIVSGDGVEDRSSALLRVSNAMVKAGLSDAEILTVLTDPDYFLGQTGYDHAETKSRAKAAAWVRKFTLGKARRDSDAATAFADEVGVDDAPTLPPERVAAQLAELIEEKDWRELVERGSPESGSRPKNTLKNVILILRGEGGDAVFRRDEFANSDLYGASTPWGGRSGAEIIDADTTLIKEWLSRKWRFEPSNDRINEAVTWIAVANRFHPVRDYLDALRWDGVPRIDTWMKRLLSAEAVEPYLSAVSRKTLVAMVARIYDPGVKYDQVLILQGIQGRGKSRALNALVGDDWFTDAPINVGDKDAILTMRAKWLIELGELSGMSKADTEALKAFISTRSDRIRVPYGKRSENFPRQCIFIGSTNKGEYLRDMTGNRRYWPVNVGWCDVDAIRAERDQLLAEAKFARELGEALWLDQDAEAEGAEKEQKAREVRDAWEDILVEWLAGGETPDADVSPKIDRTRFHTRDIFGLGGPLSTHGDLSPANQKRLGEILAKLGYQAKSAKDPITKKARWLWVKPTKVTSG